MSTVTGETVVASGRNIQVPLNGRMTEIVNSIAAPAAKEEAYSASLAHLPRHVEDQVEIYSTHDILRLNPL